jgi:hypothetical protein
LARPLALAPDTAITAEQAGEALHRLTYYRANRMYTQLVPTLPSYRQRALYSSGEDESRLGLRISRWPTELIERALAGQLFEHEVEWLAQLSEHPLHGDFETFARAPEADILGTRYQLPVQGGWERLVPTELGPVREAFQSQWGRAALAVQRGELEQADSVIRTAVGGALQMVRNAPFEVDVIEALTFLDRALRSLALLVEARDGTRPEWADALNAGRSARWTKGHRGSLFSDDATLVYHALPFIVRDPEIPQAFKRFAYRQVVLFDVCLGLRQDQASRRELRYWREAVEAGLVRRESEGQVLEMMRGSVQDLLLASDVTPETICAPSVVVRPQARFAIMSAPLRSLTAAYPPLIASEFHQHD